MSNEVYANMMEISCKAANGKSICAMPDVCMTPPQTPATPPGVPIPYPNTGTASDCSDGSTTVKISDQEVMLKNKSFFKKSTGDEAGSAPMKGVITNTITGKVYFNAWSMDVNIEGENVVRHLDITTHNHASPTPNSLIMVYQDMLASLPSECATMKAEFETKCSSAQVDGNKVNGCSEGCKEAQKCILVPKKDDKKFCCGTNTDTEARTGDHLVEVSCFTQPGGRGDFPAWGSRSRFCRDLTSMFRLLYQKPSLWTVSLRTTINSMRPPFVWVRIILIQCIIDYRNFGIAQNECGCRRIGMSRWTHGVLIREKIRRTRH